MNFLTIFPETENIHLIKDVGMIPFHLNKRYGYEVTIACYKNGEYPYLDTELIGVNIVFIKRIFGNCFLDGLIFIIFNSSKYNVIHTFHYRLRSLIWLYFYKLINLSGKTFLKLDASQRILNYGFGGFKGMIQEYLLKKIDLVSVETSHLANLLTSKWGRKVCLIPNGFSGADYSFINFEQKENKILSVGRIGAPEKRTDILLSAFAIFSEIRPNWILELVGPIEPHFQNYLLTFFNKYPNIKDRVFFSGSIQNRQELFNRYASAKIFCLTSEYESFGISLVEAASKGCYIVCSSILSANDITNKEKHGRIFPINDLEALANILIETTGNEQLLQSNCIEIQDYAFKTFSWTTIVETINESLKEKRIK